MYAPEPPPPVAPSSGKSQWPFTVVLLATLVLAAGLLALYLAPEWSLRWRRAEDQAMAEAVYLRRQAQGRAEREQVKRGKEVDRRRL